MATSDCKKLVLIVEDDHDVRESLFEALEVYDYSSLAACNGSEGLEQLRTSATRPCLILLDVMMPVMDGWGFRAVQKDDPELRSIPVVVLTAGASAEQVALQMGAEGFLKKPVKLERLVEVLRTYC